LGIIILLSLVIALRIDYVYKWGPFYEKREPEEETDTMNLKCKLFGHKPYEDFTESGYEICSRCKAHGYYDNNEITNRWNEGAILVKWFWALKHWVKDKCYDLSQWYRIYIKKELPF